MWREHASGSIRSAKSHSRFPTKRRFLKKINSGAVSEKLRVKCAKSLRAEDAEG